MWNFSVVVLFTITFTPSTRDTLHIHHTYYVSYLPHTPAFLEDIYNYLPSSVRSDDLSSVTYRLQPPAPRRSTLTPDCYGFMTGT